MFVGLDNSGKTTMLYTLSDQIKPSYYHSNRMYHEAAQLLLGDVAYSIYELTLSSEYTSCTSSVGIVQLCCRVWSEEMEESV